VAVHSRVFDADNDSTRLCLAARRRFARSSLGLIGHGERRGLGDAAPLECVRAGRMRPTRRPPVVPLRPRRACPVAKRGAHDSYCGAGQVFTGQHTSCSEQVGPVDAADRRRGPMPKAPSPPTSVHSDGNSHTGGDTRWAIRITPPCQRGIAPSCRATDRTGAIVHQVVGIHESPAVVRCLPSERCGSRAACGSRPGRPAACAPGMHDRAGVGFRFERNRRPSSAR